MTEATPPGGLPTLVVLNDGTAIVAGRRGEVRLSDDRKRWWDGVVWSSTAASTPRDAIRNAASTQWWDGVEWRPIAKVRPWYASTLGLLTVYVATLTAFVLSSATGSNLLLALWLLLVVVSLAATLRAQFLRARAKALYILLGVVGVGIEWLLQYLDRRSRDLKVAASASRL